MTGVGKSYTGQLIAESLFKEGSKSKFVHKFVGSTYDFSDDKMADIFKVRKTNLDFCCFRVRTIASLLASSH